MTLSTRYILRRLLLPFFLGLCIFTGVLILVEFFHLTDLIINKGVPFSAIFLLLATKIPETFSVTVPMSLIMAVIMTFSRMTNDNELTSLRMAGYPLHRMLVPPLIVGLVLAVGLVGLNEYGLPQLSKFKKRTLARLQIVNPIGLMKPRTYLEIPPFTIYAESIDGNSMESVWIEDRRPSKPQIIISRHGRWIRRNDREFTLKLRDGTLHQKGSDGSYRILEFQKQTLDFEPSVNVGSVGSDETIIPLSERYHNYRALSEKLQKRREAGKSTEKLSQKYYQSGTDFYRSLALPFATFFLVLVTAPTGMLTKRYGTVADLIFCLSIFFLYYIILTLAESFAKMGYVFPGFAMWSPNLLFGILGCSLFWYIRRYGV